MKTGKICIKIRQTDKMTGQIGMKTGHKDRKDKIENNTNRYGDCTVILAFYKLTHVLLNSYNKITI
jgi:hypothetical protein